MKSKDLIQEEALAATDGLKRSGAGITMGGGKTLLGLRHMAKNYTDYARFLVVAPKVSIFEEWKAQAVKHKFEYLLPHITFSTYISLDKEEHDYDGVYLDECHSLLYVHRPWLLGHMGYILGLSGTPPKYDKSEKGKMVAEFCPIVYEYLVDEAVNDQMLNDYQIIVHTLELDTNKTLKVEKGDKIWYTSERASYDYWCKRIDEASTQKELNTMRIMRMGSLKGFPSKVVLAKKILSTITNKVLVFANTQKQADSFGLPTYHSSNPKSKENLAEFIKGLFKKMVAVDQLNEGTNVDDLKEGIIMHAYANERRASQRIGRMLRLNPSETAIIHVLCYRNTVDETWVKQALEDFDQSKIQWQ
jgi:superfamily II DNA or RNA helicase